MPLSTFISIAFFSKAAIMMEGLTKRVKVIWPHSAPLQRLVRLRNRSEEDKSWGATAGLNQLPHLKPRNLYLGVETWDGMACEKGR